MTTTADVCTDCEDTIGDSRASTVFLGIDHSFGGTKPILYETMVFGGPLGGRQERYCTREDAIAGHAAMVARVTLANAKLSDRLMGIVEPNCDI